MSTLVGAVYLYGVLGGLVAAIVAVPVYHGYQNRPNSKAGWFWPATGLIALWPATLVFGVAIAVAHLLHSLGGWLRERNDKEDAK